MAADGNLPRKTEVGVYAERVVRDLLGGANGRVWRGELTGVVRWVVRVVPVRWVVSLFLSFLSFFSLHFWGGRSMGGWLMRGSIIHRILF